MEKFEIIYDEDVQLTQEDMDKLLEEAEFEQEDGITDAEN